MHEGLGVMVTTNAMSIPKNLGMGTSNAAASNQVHTLHAALRLLFAYTCEFGFTPPSPELIAKPLLL